MGNVNIYFWDGVIDDSMKKGGGKKYHDGFNSIQLEG